MCAFGGGSRANVTASVLGNFKSHLRFVADHDGHWLLGSQCEVRGVNGRVSGASSRLSTRYSYGRWGSSLACNDCFRAGKSLKRNLRTGTSPTLCLLMELVSRKL
jgi:hypothetical protein